MPSASLLIAFKVQLKDSGQLLHQLWSPPGLTLLSGESFFRENLGIGLQVLGNSQFQCLAVGQNGQMSLRFLCPVDRLAPLFKSVEKRNPVIRIALDSEGSDLT